MEKMNEDQGKVKNVENVKEYSLREQVQHPCRGDSKHKYNQDEFPICEEDDYPSLHVIKDTYHQKNDEVKDKITTILPEETQITIHHFSEDELIEHPISCDCLVPQNVNDASDQIECFEDAIIE